jgi:hypothetical protein
MAAEDTVVVHPNRERPESKSTKAAVVVLLIATAALTLIIFIGGFTKIPGQRPVTVLFVVVFGILAYYVWQWSRGSLAMAAGITTIFFMGVIVALPGWFGRDKVGFDDPLFPAGLLGLLTLVLAFVCLAVILLSMVAFQQGWNVEVEVPRDEAEGGIDPDKWDPSSGGEEGDEDEADEDAGREEDVEEGDPAESGASDQAMSEGESSEGRASD